jgi:subtilisin family serine protease
VNGWDFIGGKNGSVQYDQFEITRLYKELSDKYRNVSVSDHSDAGYQEYLKIKQDFEEKSSESTINYALYKKFLNDLEAVFALVGNDNPTTEQLQNLTSVPDSLQKVKIILIEHMKDGSSSKELHDDLEEAIDEVASDAQYHYNPDYNSRTIVGDNYQDITERYYGNNDVAGPDPMHGTHVSGIIGADRDNDLGVKGVAENVKILVVRCVPDGDERDKDVGNSIRYAVDMGAKVINMSFGKGYTYNKKAVDDAMKYAMEHDVLLVHGAGNDGFDCDAEPVYPNKYFADGGVANNYVNVGASMWGDQVAMFSDYGKKNVDVFAPGVAIYSTVPGNKYRNLQGTSMASPMVAGVAAMIRSYYPSLTAPQVREILIKSCTKMKGKVLQPQKDEDDSEGKMVKWKTLCVSGGIVNAYKALQLAAKKAR